MRIIAELALRFPQSGGDTESHRARINALATDCADIETDVLLEACKLAIKESRFLPTAAELHELVKRVKNSREGVGTETWLQGKLRQFNLKCIAEGSPVRAVADKGGNVDFFRINSVAEVRRCDGKGGVLVPYFCRKTRDWIYPA